MIEGLPDWVVFVGGGLGIAISVAVTRLGQTWGAKLKENGTSSRHVELAGALIDNSVVERLTAAIEAETMESITRRKEVTDAHKRQEDHVHMVCRRLESLSEAVRAHEQAIEDQTKEMIRRR